MEQKNSSPLCLLPISQMLLFHGCADLHFLSRALGTGWRRVGRLQGDLDAGRGAPLQMWAPRCFRASAFSGNKDVVHLLGAEGKPLGSALAISAPVRGHCRRGCDGGRTLSAGRVTAGGGHGRCGLCSCLYLNHFIFVSSLNRCLRLADP